MKTKSTILCLLTACLPFFLRAQAYLDKPVTLKIEQKTLYEIFGELERQTGVRLCCDPAILPWYRLSYNFEGQSLYKVLGKILPPAGLMFAKLDEEWLAVVQASDMKAAYLRELGAKCRGGQIEMPDFLKPVVQRFTLGDSTRPAGQVSLNGVVRDAESGEALYGASISAGEGQISSVSNALGQFFLRFPSGKTLFRVNLLGYRESLAYVSAWENGAVEILMTPVPQALQEVSIQGNAAMNRRNSALNGVEALPVQSIRELPSLMGEADVVKSLNTLAGVSSAGDGATGFNVRGGNVDQNLTLQDDAVLFNTSHVLGFFSIYNPDLLRSVTLYKGHVPAQYGGRISSVLDVKIKDGDFQRYSGQLGAGLASARLLLDGPIVKNRVSLILGLRRSYADWMLNYVYTFAGSKSSAWFFDGLGKLSFKLGKERILAISTYGTNDFFRYGESFGFRWNNRLVNCTFRHPVRGIAASVWQVNAGRYQGSYFKTTGTDAFNLQNGLQYANAGWRLTWPLNERHEFVGGFQLNRTLGMPETVRPYDDRSLTLPDSVAKDRGDEAAFFVQDEWTFNAKLKLSLGLRQVFYRNFGEKWLYQYAPGQLRSDESITDSLYYGKNKTIDWRSGLEPRFSLNYKLSSKASLKFSYNRMRQYIHLISNLVSPTPVDVWQVSNPYIAPQTGDNFDLGFYRDNADYEFTGDIFFRINRNVPIFKSLPKLLLNSHIETELAAARARSYGLELSVKKLKGHWTGWINYTWARSFIRTPVRTDAHVVNSGAWFPSDYDQPHQLNLFAKFAWNPAASVAFNVVYRRGRPVSGPQNNYVVSGVVIPDFGLRNNLRIQDYFRTDVSLNLDQNKAKISGAKVGLNLALYNLIGRNNPYSVFFQKPADSYPRAYKLSVIGACIPAIGLNLTF